GQYINTAVAVAHQHGGALVDEQAGQLGGFLQGAAAIVAQVDDQAVDALLFQFLEQALHITRGALVVRVAGAIGLEVQVEGRNLDHAELELLAFVFQFDDRFLGSLLLELDRLAGDDHLAAGQVVRRVAGGDHLQADLRALGTADQLDHLVEAPADHVDHLLVILTDADDAVGRCQLLGLLGRTGGNQADDLHVLVVALQDGADALQRQAHVDVEVLGVVRRQIVGVRIVGLRESVDVGLEDVLAAGPLQPAELVAVAAGQQFLDGGHYLAGDLQKQDLVLDALAPEVIEGSAVARPGRLLAVHLETLVDGKVQLV